MNQKQNLRSILDESYSGYAERWCAKLSLVLLIG
jgi:hypothetical protein